MRIKGINSKVPNNDGGLALLEEIYKAGGELDTSTLIYRAMAHFPQIQTDDELNRETPSGREWWKGRFRFDLSTLGKNGEAVNIKRGRWRITPKGVARLKKSGYLH